MFAGIDKQNVNDCYFYEIYENDAAYAKHVESKQFKDYISSTQEMVIDKDLQILDGEILVSQGQLEFDE